MKKSPGIAEVYVTYCGGFIAFYLPIEKSKQVLIIAIMYGKRDIAKVLNNLK